MPFYRDRVTRKKLDYAELGVPAVFIHYNGKGSLTERIRSELAKSGLDLR
jgi:hypothetical protein